MKTKKTLLKRIITLFNFNTRVYWVFRNYVRIVNEANIDDLVLDVSFQLHFVEPFSSKKEAKKHVKFAQELEPWQKFFILTGTI